MTDKTTIRRCAECRLPMDRMDAPVGMACRCHEWSPLSKVLDAALRRSVTIEPDPRDAEIKRLRAALGGLLRCIDNVPWRDVTHLRLGPGVPAYDDAKGAAQ